MEQLLKCINQFKAETAVPCIKLTAEIGKNIPITNSKVGGKPYLPKGFEYPTNKKGQPLNFLAQINFEEMPSLEHFPKGGILQFYILGMEFQGKLSEISRVVYHEKISDQEQQEELPVFDEYELPFEPEFEFKLTGELSENFIDLNDERFETIFTAICEKNSFEFDDECEDTAEMMRKHFAPNYYDFFKSSHLIGGYPRTPQGISSAPKDSHLLFQLDTQYDDNLQDFTIMWGDVGVGHFFISLENLRNCRFDQVYYDWSC